jgi:hypothetical protein
LFLSVLIDAEMMNDRNCCLTLVGIDFGLAPESVLRLKPIDYSLWTIDEHSEFVAVVGGGVVVVPYFDSCKENHCYDNDGTVEQKTDHSCWKKVFF